MTDSMKFGPEWLRNMSADNSLISNHHNSNNNNQSQSGNNSGSGGANGTSGQIQNSAGSGLSTASPRNLLSEYRYGREEMLSLFDKHCSMPDILPSYKKLFVEKVQCPLALTPSTDEELLPQGPPTQRPSWLQRSPVGFGSSIRGLGRGGSTERGRMRGKPTFHGMYARPMPGYEDDLRAGTIKSERSWPERNGSGDTYGMTSGGGSSSSSVPGTDWNNTPISSPRKDFTGHNRNLENWRRNRSDECPGDTGSSEGWRSSSSGGGGAFATGHRWGRSSSWRDEEVSHNIEGIYTSGQGGGNLMQRSISAIGTSERPGYTNGSRSSITSLSCTGPPTSQRSVISIRHNGPKDTWSGSANSGGSGLHHHPDGGEDNLPEWAMENPTDVGGGTFDANGAFHGSLVDSEGEQKSKKDDDGQGLATKDKRIDGRTTTKTGNGANVVEKDKAQNQEEEVLKAQSPTLLLEKNSTEMKNNKECDTKVETDGADCVSTQERKAKSVQGSSSGVDYSDRMCEVADDMVQKLIMEDDLMSMGKFTKLVEQEEKSISKENVIGSKDLHGATPTNVVESLTTLESNVKRSVSIVDNNQTRLPHVAPPIEAELSGAGNNNNVPTSAPAPNSLLSPSIPSDMWYYRDPQSKIQGPFSSLEMSEWYRAGYFNETLLVRRSCDPHFYHLGELLKFCNGNMPFTNSHLLPSTFNIENVHFANVVSLQRDNLKGNVVAAADSIGSAIKNVMSGSGDMSHVHMQFQMLQAQHIREQEHRIVAELSKNECFLHLPPLDQESVVRQKLQLLKLPDYLTSLAGLSNSLSMLTPNSSQQQLHDAIAEFSKKNQLYNNHHPHGYMDREDFLMNPQVQSQQQDPSQSHTPFADNPAYMANLVAGGGIDNCGPANMRELNLQMLFHGRVQTPTPHHQPEFMTEQQILAAATQNPLRQMWLPAAMGGQGTSKVIQSSQLLPPQQEPTQMRSIAAGPWSGGPLVGIPNAVINSTANPAHIPVTSALNVSKGTTDLMMTSRGLWGVGMGSGDNNQNQAHMMNEGVEQKSKMQAVDKMHHPIRRDFGDGTDKENRQTESTELQNTMQAADSMKDDQRREESSASNKRNNKQQQQPTSPGPKDNSGFLKKAEDDKRRDQAEEKKRQKERKRQQMEEEKRRIQQTEEDKRHQMLLEERERQQQIQTQRRKALTANEDNDEGDAATSSVTAASKPIKEEGGPRLTSIAPWSTQSKAAIKESGPCLAEIQKAERRERRADQQRQMEILEKQSRANTAIQENNNVEGAVNKWNAPQVVVKGLAEIQAEEAKRLAAEQQEIQRRREQEQQAAMAVGLSIGSASSLSNIWSGSNKPWNTTNTAGGGGNVGSASGMGFWDEQIKPSTGKSPQASNQTVAAVPATNLPTNKSVKSQQQKLKQQIKGQPASTSSGSQQGTRNLKKSQTISVMQSSSSSKDPSFTVAPGQAKVKQPQRGIAGKSVNNTKGGASVGGGGSKNDDYVLDFVNWCEKSLHNMSNAKVDVPTFVSFLQDLESPYEVKDYIRMYLGEGKECTDFAKQFLERRSKIKNLQRAQNAHNDDMCKPAPAINPVGNENSDKGKQKKVKKNKMTKLDARILGFSVTAAEGRINVGDRDYVDAP